MNEAQLLADIGQLLIKELGTITFVGSIEIIGHQRIANDFHPVYVRGQIVAEALNEQAKVQSPAGGGIPNQHTVRNAAAKVNERVKRVVKRSAEPATLPVQFHRRERVGRSQT